MTIDAYKHQIEARPTPTREQYDAARAYMVKHAPDLYDYLFGSAS